MNSMVSPSPFMSLSMLIGALRAAVGGWGKAGVLGTALMFLLHRRLGRIAERMERLAARFQAGRLRRVGPRARAESGGRAGPERAKEPRLWPGRFGWLVRLASYPAAGFGCQLQAILGEPEMVALLEAAPQARRLLRPLCRMLAVETKLLHPRAAGTDDVPADVAVVKVAVKRVRKKRPPVDWGRIRLPRGVLTAARRQGFGKVPRD